MQQTLTSPESTMKAGTQFAKKLRGGDIVLLHGELGAGKTTFVKGIARGLGVKETITSPTFTLMGVYSLPLTPPSPGPALARPARRPPRGEVDLRLCHIDTYRLKNADELRAIGAEEYIGDLHTITIIEWPEKITALLRGKKTKNVFFTHIDGGRSITVQ